MTKYVVFDVETTGLTSRDEVIQFAGFILDENLHATSVVNFYSDTQAQISANAFNVHHLSKAKIHQLSEGKFFEDNWLSLIDELRQHQVVWVDWSRGCFDERLINQTLVNNGLPDYFHFPVETTREACLKNRISIFNLMSALCHKLGRSSLKLEAAANTLPYSKEQINRAYDIIFNIVPNCDSETRYHNALYDAFVTYIIFKYYFA